MDFYAIGSALADLKKMAGPRANVFCEISASKKPLSVTVYLLGIGADGPVARCEGDDAAKVLGEARAKVEQLKISADAERLRQMATAIIVATDEHGSCSDAALRVAGFSSEEIDALGVKAVERADEMAGRGPFSIIFAAPAANAA